MAAGFLVLFASLTSPQALSPIVVAGWVAVIISLVILRQILVVRENQRLSEQLRILNTGLEERVAERTAALIRVNEELHEREKRLVYNALHDSLTGLPNRALLIDRLDQSLRRMRRDPEYAFAVLFMDLDGFKVINDSMGHVAGDRLLVETSHRLTGSVREIDTVSRLGGDEFVILLDGCPAGEPLNRAVERVQAALDTPLAFDGQQAFMAASIGIVRGSPDYAEPADILRDADLAMYEAKAQGKARFVVFTPELRAYALDRLMLEKDLRLALEHHELRLHYQPVMNLEKGGMIGFEALLRWPHARLGMISPGTFIPIAESNGQIVPITYWVLEEALIQLRIWHEHFPTGPSLTMSVNLSARMFNQPDLIPQVKHLLVKTGISAEYLVLEITESAIIQDAKIAIKILQEFQEMGVKVHMDDFGTGYSSLNYLHQFPINSLKVAQEFVSRIEPDGENGEIVRTIVTLAHDLGLEVIAEGIETAEQMAYMRQLGCQGGQGFFISRGLTASDASQFILEHAILKKNSSEGWYQVPACQL